MLRSFFDSFLCLGFERFQSFDCAFGEQYLRHSEIIQRDDITLLDLFAGNAGVLYRPFGEIELMFFEEPSSGCDLSAASRQYRCTIERSIRE